MPLEFAARDLVRTFPRPGSGTTIALDHVSLDVEAGQRLGIVGESGSGKSTLVRTLAALLRPTSGTIEFRGTNIVGLRERDLAELRANVALVFQDPRSSLNPRMNVGRIITEPLRSPLLRGRPDVPADQQARLEQVMTQVGLDPSLANRYPHEFSGGQRQRIAIARALAPNPDILIADEAVSALDVSVRAQVLNLLMDAVANDGLTLLFVSHDLSVVRHLCDMAIVMRAGRVVEAGTTEQIWSDPREPHTRELLAAVPKVRMG